MIGSSPLSHVQMRNCIRNATLEYKTDPKKLTKKAYFHVFIYFQEKNPHI